MLYLANPCGPETLAAMRAGQLGFIDTPRQQNKRPAGVAWCADNGCFSDKWDEVKWWSFLVRHAGDAGTCLFAVAPDVVADARRTYDKSLPWLPRIRTLGYPVAYVAQDGIDRHPAPSPEEYDALFIGGSDEFKLGPLVPDLITEAKQAGHHVHAGRVNSERRFEYFRALGADTADGTILTHGARKNLPRVMAWNRAAGQPYLFA